MMAMGKFNMVQIWTWMASFGFLTSILQEYFPMVYTDKLRRNFRYWLERLSPYVFCDVHEFANSQRNSLYQDVQLYISSLKVQGAHRMSLSKPNGSKEMTLDLSDDQLTIDTFDRSEMEWVHRVSLRARPLYIGYFGESASDERKTYTLQIRKKDKERVLDAYMKHIEAKATEAKLAARHLQLFTNKSSESRHSFMEKSAWQSVPFMPPANFDTLALDGDLKSEIVSDLDTFAADEQFYKRVGKAWKRGYLLFGPPGTGKSSMIAAMANKLRYDVYDLELTEVKSNGDLRTLLIETSNKSIIVIEDIDCSLDLSGQRKKKKESKTSTGADGKPPPPGPKPPKKEDSSKVTLSGLLNFVDGLWSCCGSERIFIFTTNYKEKLDPALLRAGRMDMHIHLSYCTFSAFKILALNYLQITDHELFEKLESAFVGSFMTPAEVSEVLIKNRQRDVAATLESLTVALGEHRVDPSTLKTSEEDSDDDEESQDEKTAKAEKDNSCNCSSSPKEVHIVEEEKKPIAVTSSAAAAVSKSDGTEIVHGQQSGTKTKEEESSPKEATSLVEGSEAESLKTDDDVVKEIPDATTVSTADQVASISSGTQA